MQLLHRLSADKIRGETKRYIHFCEKARDIIDREHYFLKGDFFYHLVHGLKVTDRNLGDGRLYSDSPELKIFKIETKECCWLPTEEQLKKVAGGINLTPESLALFLDHKDGLMGYASGLKPRTLFPTPEEQWLAYFLFERYERVWSKDADDWIAVQHE
jgi:hypothetical protein